MFIPVTPKTIVSIDSAAEQQAINATNVQASLAEGKLVNRGMLTSANDDMVPEKQSVEYFRANRDASIATTPLLHGAKNDIILSAYGGVNTYSFVLEIHQPYSYRKHGRFRFLL